MLFDIVIIVVVIVVRYTKERKGLIADFRKHFREYNLSEER